MCWGWGGGRVQSPSLCSSPFLQLQNFSLVTGKKLKLSNSAQGRDKYWHSSKDPKPSGTTGFRAFGIGTPAAGSHWPARTGLLKSFYAHKNLWSLIPRNNSIRVGGSALICFLNIIVTGSDGIIYSNKVQFFTFISKPMNGSKYIKLNKGVKIP